MVRKLDKQTRRRMALNSGDYDARIRYERVFCIQVAHSHRREPFSKEKGKGRVSICCGAEPNSAEMLMKTIVSVNQVSINRTVLTSVAWKTT